MTANKAKKMRVAHEDPANSFIIYIVRGFAISFILVAIILAITAIVMVTA